MRKRSMLVASVASTVLIVAVSQANSQVRTIKLGQDQIATVKIAEGITTRVVFAEQVKEIICGDLYDPESGRGGFVVQRIRNDVFLKPIVRRGITNLFVKTGDNGEHTFGFDVVVVAASEADRVLNITGLNPEPVARAEAKEAVAREDIRESKDIKESKESKKAVQISSAVVSSVSTSLMSTPPRVRTIDMSLYVGGTESAGVNEELALRRDAITPAPPPPAPVKSDPVTHAPVTSAPAASAPAKKVTDTQNIASSRKIMKQVAPEYPEMARKVAASGEVVVEVTVDSRGKVTSAKAISGPFLLRGSAVVAASFWRFAAIEDAGEQSVPGEGPGLQRATITFNFRGPDQIEALWNPGGGSNNTSDRRTRR